MISVVTAVSSNHYKTVLQFLKSIPSNIDIYLYDIGLSYNESEYIIKSFPNVYYKLFNFDKYPDFIRLTSPDAGAYAWKPIIVSELYKQLDTGILCWCDSGNLLTNTFKDLTHIVNNNKIYTPVSSGTIQRWTHPTCIENMKVDPQHLNFINRNAACIGFKCNDEFVRNFISEWATCALVKDIILPPGANRSNHRHDQSILTILYYKYNVPLINYYVGFTIHNDLD